MRRRGAFTLVETVAAMAVLSTIFGVMVLSIYSLQKTSVLMTGMMDAAFQRQRFSTQLRRDAHQASHAELKKGHGQQSGRLLELALAGGDVVTYELMEEGIERRLEAGNEVVHREFFAIAPLLEEGWSLDTTRECPLLSVALSRGLAIEPGAKSPREALRVAAAIQVTYFDDTVASASSLP